MGKRMKAFLPRWVLWVVMPVLAIMWIIVTYATFATPTGEDGLGVIGWLAVTLVMILMGVMLWLMASGRLPLYTIEVEDTDEPDKSARS